MEWIGISGSGLTCSSRSFALAGSITSCLTKLMGMKCIAGGLCEDFSFLNGVIGEEIGDDGESAALGVDEADEDARDDAADE